MTNTPLIYRRFPNETARPAGPKRHSRVSRLALRFTLLFLSPSGFTAAAGIPELQSQARAVLARALRDESGFVRIHAAEALLDNGSGETVRAAFAGSGTGATADPARIGTWRVLALASTTDAGRAAWIGRVRQVALNTTAVDRIQALETLGKLHVRLDRSELDAIRDFATHASPADAIMPWWVLQINGEPDALARIMDGLGAADPIARLRASYVLKRDHITGERIQAALTRACSAEAAASAAYPYLLCALATLTEGKELQQDYIERLGRLLAEPTASGRYEMSLTLMQLWPAANAGRLETLLAAQDADTRIGAAWAVLRLTTKQ